jgi:hypothetical protein
VVKFHLQKICGNVAYFSDGDSRVVRLSQLLSFVSIESMILFLENFSFLFSVCHIQIDAIVMCTGYESNFTFLESSLQLKTSDCLVPLGLYKGITWINNPCLYYIGMQAQFFTFVMYDAQAWWIRDAIANKIKLPSKSSMVEHNDKWLLRGEREVIGAKDIFANSVDFQATYIKDLMSVTNCPKFDIDLVVRNFLSWDHDKRKSVIGYRDKAFLSSVDGMSGTLPTIRWFDFGNNEKSEETEEIKCWQDSSQDSSHG